MRDDAEVTAALRKYYEAALVHRVTTLIEMLTTLEGEWLTRSPSLSPKEMEIVLNRLETARVELLPLSPPTRTK